MTLRTPPVALALLLLSFALPAGEAALTCAGQAGPRVCLGTGPCYGASAATGATDLHPTAAFCKTPAVDGAYLCGRADAGVATLGGFYGPQASLCVLGERDPLVLCAGPGGGFFDPVCL